MRDTKIILALRNKLEVPVGRHLYGVLGSYEVLEKFAKVLQEEATLYGNPFPPPVSVTRGIIEAFSDEEFRSIVKDEAQRPEATRKSVELAFENFLRIQLEERKLLVLNDLEILFPYNTDFSPLRTMATDEDRIILLLPGKKSGERIVMYPNLAEGEYKIPKSLIANDHLWEVTY
jgi:hypothetical protein